MQSIAIIISLTDGISSDEPHNHYPQQMWHDFIYKQCDTQLFFMVVKL